ncbi:hypothetical protein WDU94_015595, partial [Cyamophila willieti]
KCGIKYHHDSLRQLEAEINELYTKQRRERGFDIPEDKSHEQIALGESQDATSVSGSAAEAVITTTITVFTTTTTTVSSGPNVQSPASAPQDSGRLDRLGASESLVTITPLLPTFTSSITGGISSSRQVAHPALVQGTEGIISEYQSLAQNVTGISSIHTQMAFPGNLRFPTPYMSSMGSYSSAGGPMSTTLLSGSYVPAQTTVPIYRDLPTVASGSHQNPGSTLLGYQGNTYEVKARPPRVDPPCFDGKEDVEEFLKGYNLAASVNNWDDALKCKYLPIFVRGPAKTLFENKIENRAVPWCQIEDILRSYFTPVGNEDLVEYKMRSRVQGPVESAEPYMQEKLGLINKFDRQMTEVNKAKLIMYGLLPDILARVSLMEGNQSLEGLRTNIQKVEIANHRVNLRVRGIQTQSESQHQPAWATDLINVIKDIKDKSHQQTNNNNNNSLHREVEQLRNEIQFMRASPQDTGSYGAPSQHKQYQSHQPRYQSHQPRYQSHPPHYQSQQYQDMGHQSRRDNPRTFNESRYNSRERNNSRYRKVDSNENSPSRRVSPKPFERTSSGRLVKCYGCGAGKSVVSHGLVKTLPELKLTQHDDNVKLCSAGGELLHIMGQVVIPIQVEGEVLETSILVIKNLVPDILIGMDFLRKFKAILDFDRGRLSLRTKSERIRTRFIESELCSPNGEFFLAGTYEQTTHRGEECSKARVKFSSHLETHNRIEDNQQVQVPIRTQKELKSILKKNGDNMKKSPSNPVEVVPHRVPETQGCIDVGILNINELTSKLAVRKKLEDAANISPDVSFADKERLINILSRYKECLDAFSNDIGGNARVAPIKLTLKDNIPVRTPPYRVSLKERQIMAEIVEDMKRQGIVYNSSSPYASPALLVRKNSKVKKTRRQELTKDDFRLCVDYRGVNKHIDQSSWPLERAEDIFARLANSSYYITADLKSGFLQLPLDKESQMVLSAVTQDCSFAYNTLPFGVNCAPNLFQKTMREVFQDIKPEDLLIFMDDLVIHAQTIDELLKKFENVMKRMEEVNLKINLSKCQFLFSEIDLLGHRISKEGVMVSQSKVKSIVDFKAPKTVKQVRQFLGMSGYYRKFCQDYSRIAAPLTDLTKQDKKFEWTEREQKAFDRLKEMLISAPVLRHFDENLPTILSTDASIDGIGAVLEQTDEHGKTHPVAYASRKLSPTERRYANIDREGLGISWAIGHYRHFLYMKKFTVYTDCEALTHLSSVKDPSSRLTRFALKMQEYDMVIKYKPGAKNAGPDFLSRNPIGPAPRDDIDESIPVFSIGEVDLPRLQREDDELSVIIKALEHPSSADTADLRKSRRYVIKNDLLYKRGRDPSFDVVAVPQSLQRKLIHERHTSLLGGGHLGVAKCIESLKSKYYWPNLEESVRDFIQRCEHCQYRKNPNNKEKPGLLHPVTKSNNENVYVIAACEYLSGYLVTKAVKKVTSEDVCDFLMELVVQFGVPHRIVTDNGSNLVSKSVNQFLDQVGCRRVAISGYHPQSNGLIESCFKSLKNMLSMYVSPNHKDWDTFLPSLTFTLNSCVREAEEIDTRLAKMRVIRELTAEHYNSGKDKQKEYYDRNRKHVEYEVGTLVMLYSPRTFTGKCRKFTLHWQGPYNVIEVKNDGLNYVIKDSKIPIYLLLKILVHQVMNNMIEVSPRHGRFYYMVMVVSMLIMAQGSEAVVQLGDGLHMTETTGTIAYENTLPILYEFSWTGLSDEDEEQSNYKWKQCTTRMTCLLRKLLGQYKAAVSTQLDKLVSFPADSTKQKRFSVAGWMLMKCCGVATEDQFHQLYQQNERVAIYLSNFNNSLTADHEAITDMIEQNNNLTRDLNGILNKSRQALTDELLEQTGIDAKESIVIEHLMSLYAQQERAAEILRMHTATNACQAKHIPSTIVSPELLKKDLLTLLDKMKQNSWELSIPVGELGRYYTTEIASCIISSKKIIVRVKIPVKHTRRSWRVSFVRSIPMGDFNSTCLFQTPSNKILIQNDKFGWILNDQNCRTESDGLCHIPRDLQLTPLKSMSHKLEVLCTNNTETILTHLVDETFSITHPPKIVNIIDETNNSTRDLQLPENVHGYVNLNLPCDHAAIIGEMTINSIFPCDASWTRQVTMNITIPTAWVRIKDPDQVLESLTNESRSYADVMTTLLNSPEWHLTQKFIEIRNPDLEDPDTILNMYSEIKEDVSEYTVEWSFVITILIIIVLFRKPINMLLIYLIPKKKETKPEFEVVFVKHKETLASHGQHSDTGELNN